jgi:hypothetical protein
MEKIVFDYLCQNVSIEWTIEIRSRLLNAYNK